MQEGKFGELFYLQVLDKNSMCQQAFLDELQFPMNINKQLGNISWKGVGIQNCSTEYGKQIKENKVSTFHLVLQFNNPT